MDTLKTAIDKAGGPAEAAKVCQVSPRAVYKWIASEALPRTEYTGETRYAELLAAAASGRGQPFDPARLKEVARPKTKNETPKEAA